MSRTPRWIRKQRRSDRVRRYFETRIDWGFVALILEALEGDAPTNQDPEK